MPPSARPSGPREEPRARARFWATLSCVAKNEPSGAGAALALGGLAALGLLAWASTTRTPVRRTFEEELRDELLTYGIALMTAQLGRQHEHPMWIVTCQRRIDQVLFTVQVPVLGDPFDPVMPRSVAERIAQALEAR